MSKPQDQAAQGGEQDFDSHFAAAAADMQDPPTDKSAEAGNKAEESAQDQGANNASQANSQQQDQQQDPKDLQIAELTRQLAEAQHRERSSANRISPLNQQNDSLRSENAQLKARISELEKQLASAPANSGGGGDADDALSEAPDLRQAVVNLVDKQVQPLRQQLTEAQRKAQEAEQRASQVAQVVDPIVSDRQEQELQVIFGGLNQRYDGDWRAEIKQDRFKSWLSTQPQAIKDLYLNGETLNESAAVLDLYSSQTGHLKRKEAGGQASPEEIARQRNERLAKASGLKSGGGAPAVKKANDDFDSAFNEFAPSLAKA